MVKLAFARIAPVKIGVVGDLVLDMYTIGKALRISPEAPVPVLSVQREEMRAGGAGNVVLNMLSLGATVIPVVRVGSDRAGDHLKELFAREGVATEGIFAEAGYVTPTKNRIIAENQQIVRIDHEEISPLPELVEEHIIGALPQLFAGVQAIAVSDYGKGFVTRTLFQAIVDYAQKENIPVIVDPKDIDFSRYRGAFIIKPNESELYAAAKMPRTCSIEDAAKIAFKDSGAEHLMVTRSESGIALFNMGGERQDFPVEIQEVRDVTGAGDTVLAMLAVSAANGLSLEETAVLSNIAAGIAIARFGCARVSLSDIAERLLHLDLGNKIFAKDNLSTLQRMLKGRNVVLLSLSNVSAITPALYKVIVSAASEGDALAVYLADPAPPESIIDLLASMPAIDFILLHDVASLHLLNEELSFASMYQAEG